MTFIGCFIWMQHNKQLTETAEKLLKLSIKESFNRNAWFWKTPQFSILKLKSKTLQSTLLFFEIEKP